MHLVFLSSKVLSHRRGDQLSYRRCPYGTCLHLGHPELFGSISMGQRIKRMMLLMNEDLGPRTQRKMMLNDFSRKKNESTYGGIKRVMGDMFGMIGRWLIGNHKVLCKLTSGR